MSTIDVIYLPETKMRCFLAIAFTVHLLIATASAVPPLINYQGYLSNSAGVPLDTTVAMRVSIFPDSTGGTSNWSETYASVLVTDWLFHLQLGSLVPISDLFADSTLWLAVRVGTNAEMTPRQRLTAEPWAYRVWSVDGATGGTVTGDFSIIGSGSIGDGNTVTGSQSLAVGRTNVATGANSVCFGRGNRVRGDYSSVLGGGGATDIDSNSANGFAAVVAGGRGNDADGGYAVLGGGNVNRIQSAASYSTLGGGYLNDIGGDYTVIGGGSSNDADGNYSVVCGGVANWVSGTEGVVVGGANNFAGINGFVGGGRDNMAQGPYSVICGGDSNNTSLEGGSVLGGVHNTAGGYYSTVAGGRQNTASARYSFAAGRRANANDAGAFVWADSTDATLSSPGINTFSVRASGGIRMWTSAAADVGVTLLAGDNTWNSVCDSTLKTKLGRVDGRELLNKLMALPVYRWHHKHGDPQLQHIGPMAQDFWNQFHAGGDSMKISTIDPDGVALAAIQELAKRTEQLEMRNERLESEIRELRARLDQWALRN
ncbi:hypothetical protein HZB60_03910 [candidate division KSB1 bacterium]|nr:hypothetical protein [candidate division KSB1 bacterium]